MGDYANKGHVYENIAIDQLEELAEKAYKEGFETANDMASLGA